MRRGLLVPIVTAVMLLGASSMPAEARVPADTSASQPVEVEVPLRVIASPGNKGMNGIVEIRLGRSQPFAVMLDTGSVGLRVFPGAWSATPGGVVVTKTRVTTELDGQSAPIKGFLAKAPFTVGGVTTTRAVGFQYVNTDSPYIAAWAGRRVYGILGIGTGSYLLSNPLSALPGSVGQHWSVHFGGDPATKREGVGALVLGAEIPPDATSTFTIPALGPDKYGALQWDDHKASGCWTFGHGPRQCVDTWFDSGFNVMRVKGHAFAHLPQTPTHALRSGTRVSLAEAGSAFTDWRFRAGGTQSLDFVRVVPAGRPAINTGNALYFQYTVTYDVQRGLIGLSDSRRAAR